MEIIFDYSFVLPTESIFMITSEKENNECDMM